MQDVITWILAHQTLLAVAVVGVLDFAFAIKPDWESSGVVHWLYLQAKALTGSKPPQA